MMSECVATPFLLLRAPFPFEQIAADRDAQGPARGVSLNPVDSVEPGGGQLLPEEIVQGGMELDLAEVNHGSTSDNDRGNRLTACPDTQGTNLVARRCSEDLRRETGTRRAQPGR